MPYSEQDRPLDDWVRTTLALAVAFARSLLRDRSLAEDVVHDCYCRLLRRADVYDLPRDGTKLLYRAITNACVNLGQRKKSVESLDEARLPDKRVAGPVEVAEANELATALERGLAKLSVLQRAAVQLKAVGHTLDEIADTLGLTPSNAGVLVHRARHTLNTELAAFTKERTG